ncbi:unnamed protein product [Cochlearia groenlandica]
MSKFNLPFQVDQVVEVKSFEDGYRGAWFRCKILDIFTERKELHYRLEYVDYPDETIHTTQVYQRFKGGKEKHRMIRPPYPPVCHESEFQGNTEEPLLVIHGSWKVGDLVDWYQDDCYWSGTIMEMKEDEAVQMELIPPPYGQGEEYKALCKDLRPSLEWSPEDGWKLPSSMDGQTRQCAKLVSRKNEDACETRNVKRAKQQKTTESDTKLELNGEGQLQLNIMESDSIEAAVYDLEELIVRIEWIKDMLSPDGGGGSESSWKYEDHRPSSSSGM